MKLNKILLIPIPAAMIAGFFCTPIPANAAATVRASAVRATSVKGPTTSSPTAALPKPGGIRGAVTSFSRTSGARAATLPKGLSLKGAGLGGTTGTPGGGTNNINIDLSDYYTRGQIDDIIDNILAGLPPQQEQTGDTEPPGTLNTTATTAQATIADEPLSGAVTLHKVAKTGTYDDLIGTPAVPALPVSISDGGTGQTAIPAAFNALAAEGGEVPDGKLLIVPTPPLPEPPTWDYPTAV